MDHIQVIAALQAELETQKQQIASLHYELERHVKELAEARQRLELRNLSLERLQSQFTLAADAVNKLLADRDKIRQRPWAKLGMTLGLLPKLEDDLR
jgi:predicted  nucleic acid-binding Zn-ribbon protein